MKNLFLMGGPIFMSILTLLLLVMVIWFIYHLIVAVKSNQPDREEALRKVGYGKSIGLFAMITGIFIQLLGFYNGFAAIEEAADISPALIFTGIKISMITTLFGIFIYLLSLLLWFISATLIEKSFADQA